MEKEFIEQVRAEAECAIRELLAQAALRERDIVVVGCSSSEIVGEKIGTATNSEVAQAVFAGIYPVLMQAGVYLAAQCCEHLNRAIILPRAAAEYNRLPEVNAVPRPGAGGSFAAAVYAGVTEAVAVEYVRAGAGIDIGDTLIGMHLREVAVPVRITHPVIGQAHVVCARSRAKFIGGERAAYDRRLL
jgi:uncharacterized protein (TIGR01440 family)